MDDRTLIICAATLCVLGYSLTQTFGSSATGRAAHPPAITTASAPPAANVAPDGDSAMRVRRSFAFVD
jgi:hypothetical protein